MERRLMCFVLLSVLYLFDLNSAFKVNTLKNCEDALFLTRYIENGEVEAGRAASRVKPIAEETESYSGFFTVNKSCNSNLFFWYFPAEESPENASVIVWLQGGPGSSSLYGLFEENGAFYFEKDGTLKTREIYWSRKFHMIYIDNPVGTGFSFTGSDDCYARDQLRIGQELYSAVFQFFQLFPYLKDRDFFITGESYAGKYVPSLAYVVHTNNFQSDSKINLKGIAVGNGLTDPENMMKYGDYFYQIGLIDSNQRKVFWRLEDEIVTNIRQKNFTKASEVFHKMILGAFVEHGTYFKNYTGFSYFYNILHDKPYSPNGKMSKYIREDKMKRALHVGNRPFQTDRKVGKMLYDDIMQSVKPWVEVLLENYRVLMYSGQLDLIVPYPCTLNFLHSLDWSGAPYYRTAERKKWFVGSHLAGYSKTSGNFTELLVRNAGHMVPADQPLWAFHLISRFISNKPFQ